MKYSVLALLCASLLSACAAAPQPPRQLAEPVRSEPAKPSGFLVRDEQFTSCELDAFIAEDISRNLVLLHDRPESLKAVPSNGPMQIAMIDEVVRRMRDERLENYNLYAAQKFYECTERLSVPVVRNEAGASVCFAHLDIAFFLESRRNSGLDAEAANSSVKQRLANAEQHVYPPELVDALTPMVYRLQGADDYYELRRFIFETCLFPKDWQAWWASIHPEQGQAPQ